MYCGSWETVTAIVTAHQQIKQWPEKANTKNGGALAASRQVDEPKYNTRHPLGVQQKELGVVAVKSWGAQKCTSHPLMTHKKLGGVTVKLTRKHKTQVGMYVLVSHSIKRIGRVHTTGKTKDSFKEAWSVQWHRPSFWAFFFCFNT